MTELVHHQTSSDLSEQMDYARAISSASMLPQQYRGKPADILIATGLGRAMGLSPAESLYRIHVIQGRPTASAELIAANVRKAGHVLRVKGDEQQARAVIIRHDDPGFEFESVWDLERAKRLGLTDKDGWRKQPGTMMRWRAITEVARLACPEALYGVAYVREEIEDEQRSTPARVSVLDFTKTDAGTVESPEAAGPALSETSDEEAVPVPASTVTSLPETWVATIPIRAPPSQETLTTSPGWMPWLSPSVRTAVSASVLLATAAAWPAGSRSGVSCWESWPGAVRVNAPFTLIPPKAR